MTQVKRVPGTSPSGVERSDRRPHRSEASGDKRYYKRAGDSSFIMEHYDIEDAFNRTTPAELQLALSGIASAERSPASPGRSITDTYLAFFLSNEDRTSACAPYVWVDSNTAVHLGWAS